MGVGDFGDAGEAGRAAAFHNHLRRSAASSVELKEHYLRAQKHEDRLVHCDGNCGHRCSDAQ
jgi:hypothetical protein